MELYCMYPCITRMENDELISISRAIVVGGVG